MYVPFQIKWITLNFKFEGRLIQFVLIKLNVKHILIGKGLRAEFNQNRIAM
jgi:hypothetical protein